MGIVKPEKAETAEKAETSKAPPKPPDKTGGPMRMSLTAGSAMNSRSPSVSGTVPPSSSASVSPVVPAAMATRWRLPDSATGRSGSNPSIRRPSVSTSPWTGCNCGVRAVRSRSDWARTSVARRLNRDRSVVVSGVTRVIFDEIAKSCRVRWITRSAR